MALFPVKEKIAEQEAAIAGLEADLARSRQRACDLLQHARSNAGALSAHFKPLLDQNRARLEQWLADRRTAEVASWDQEAWRDWAASQPAESAQIRAGDILDPRSENAALTPAFLPFIGRNSTVIVHGSGQANERALALIQALVIRTAVMLPHQAAYTLVDPAGAGAAFPMRRHLAHVRPNSGDVRRDLDEVLAHIPRIIETYLDASRTSFEQVAQAGRNDRFQFVFAADFPNQYDRRAIEALQSIGTTGPKAGVYLFLHANDDCPLPRDMSYDGFRNAVHLDIARERAPGSRGFSYRPDVAPSPEMQSTLFETIKDAKPPERVVDWDSVAGLDEANWWQASATDRVETVIGLGSSGESLHLWFGANDQGQPCAHGMLGAMTGAGKSNLYHVLIAGLTTRYSPEELRLYLVDGKDGVEFESYRELPHAEVVSLRTPAELSRSVLEELVDEKERRNALFKAHGTQDLVTYRRRGQPAGNVPRILLLVDEYQQLFEDDREGIASGRVLDLAQQGRSAGIHMFLASQRFGAAGMLNQTGVFGNMHLRVAMQMTAADVQALTEFGRRGKELIATCDERGKIVINDRAGEDSGNVAGKVALLGPERRLEVLQALSARAAALPPGSLPRRVVFDGQAAPRLLDNPQFTALLRRARWPTSEELEALARAPAHEGGLGAPDWYATEQPRAAWLGQCFDVRGQAMMVIRRHSSENVAMVGRAHDARYGMLIALLAGLAINAEPRQGEFHIVDCSPPRMDWSAVLASMQQRVLEPLGFSRSFGNAPQSAISLVETLTAELDGRQRLPEEDAGRQPPVFAVFAELDRAEAFRRKPGSYGPSDTAEGIKLARLYTEGPSLGIHLLMSFSSVGRLATVIDERHGLEHFRHRVALQMSEDESHTFVRSRKANLLQADGPRPVCALYLDVEADQPLRFKPYSTAADTPDGALDRQIEVIGAELRRRQPP